MFSPEFGPSAARNENSSALGSHERVVRENALSHLIKTAANCLKQEGRKVVMQKGSSPKSSTLVLSPNRTARDGRRSAATRLGFTSTQSIGRKSREITAPLAEVNVSST